MKELIKINNKWVEPSNWKTAVISHPPIKKTNVVEEKGCKTYDEINDAFIDSIASSTKNTKFSGMYI